MDEVITEMANHAGIEFTGGETPIKDPQVQPDPLGNLRIYWEDEKIVAQVNSIDRGRRTLDCYLSIQEYDPHKWITAPVRINLLSASAKDQLRRSLNDRHALDWATRIDQIVVLVHNAANEQRQAKILKTRTDSHQQDWLAGPLLERNQHTMAVAEGGTGKSMFALALLAAVKLQEPILPGISIGDFTGGVAFLDWETDDATHERRLTQLVEANGIAWPEIHYIRMQVPLQEDVQYLYEYFIRNRIRLAVIDSVGMAVAGDMNSQADAISYISAVRALGNITVLSVTHPGWSDTKRSTGSRYFENAPRAVWRLEKQQEQGESTSHIDFENYKANNGIVQASFAVKAVFDDKGIHYEPATVTPDKKPTREQIIDVLTGISRLNLDAIYEDLPEIPKGTIRKALHDMKKAGIAENFGPKEWGLLPQKSSNSYVTDGVVTGNGPFRGPSNPDVTDTPATEGIKEEEDADPLPDF